MTDPSVTRAFLEAEVEALEAFGFVAVMPAGNPLHMVEVTRREDGGLEVRLPGRPVILPELPAPVRAKLRDRGFVSEDPADRNQPWVKSVGDTSTAVDLVQHLLTEVLEEKSDVAIDIAHGSHKAEHEARKKLGVTRAQIEKILTSMTNSPVAQDDDGDYILPLQDVQVMISPRLMHDGTVVVRVFTITNVHVNVTPELGLFLARLNFGLLFGRFALDTEHRAIWFDESLLGAQLNEELLRFTVKIVATTADEWDDRLKQMFGGATYQDVLTNRVAEGTAPTKPGQGGYL
jgi:hypothetical protein